MSDLDLPQPTWHQGVYGCPQDMYTAEQMRQHEQTVRAQIAEALTAERGEYIGVGDYSNGARFATDVAINVAKGGA